MFVCHMKSHKSNTLKFETVMWENGEMFRVRILLQGMYGLETASLKKREEVKIKFLDFC